MFVHFRDAYPNPDGSHPAELVVGPLDRFHFDPELGDLFSAGTPLGCLTADGAIKVLGIKFEHLTVLDQAPALYPAITLDEFHERWRRHVPLPLRIHREAGKAPLHLHFIASDEDEEIHLYCQKLEGARPMAFVHQFRASYFDFGRIVAVRDGHIACGGGVLP